MYLKLDNIEKIEQKNLVRIFADIDGCIHFRGRALETEGKRIHEQLSKLKTGEIIEVEFDTRDYAHDKGIYEVVELNIPPTDICNAPVIYRFSGKLKPIY